MTTRAIEQTTRPRRLTIEELYGREQPLVSTYSGFAWGWIPTRSFIPVPNLYVVSHRAGFKAGDFSVKPWGGRWHSPGNYSGYVVYCGVTLHTDSVDVVYKPDIDAEITLDAKTIDIYDRGYPGKVEMDLYIGLDIPEDLREQIVINRNKRAVSGPIKIGENEYRTGVRDHVLGPLVKYIESPTSFNQAVEAIYTDFKNLVVTEIENFNYRGAVSNVGRIVEDKLEKFNKDHEEFHVKIISFALRPTRSDEVIKALNEQGTIRILADGRRYADLRAAEGQKQLLKELGPENYSKYLTTEAQRHASEQIGRGLSENKGSIIVNPSEILGSRG